MAACMPGRTFLEGDSASERETLLLSASEQRKCDNNWSSIRIIFEIYLGLEAGVKEWVPHSRPQPHCQKSISMFLCVTIAMSKTGCFSTSSQFRILNVVIPTYSKCVILFCHLVLTVMGCNI